MEKWSYPEGWLRDNASAPVGISSNIWKNGHTQKVGLEITLLRLLECQPIYGEVVIPRRLAEG
jgi:hypothetical protein